MTLPEGLLWRELRKRPGGFKFRRQHPLGSYIADFACLSAHLIVEIDGMAHEGIPASEADTRRDQFLRQQGFTVLRLPANTVLQDIEAAIRAIVAQAENPLHQPAAGPPPRSGEELE
ncbi:MAG: endonuclease domain-containing protein [Parasphingopyxis sp.]|uniref:endonuclease domain-containing protein n=1 Tax=Parasphingopyxis sp. TaxID=1920299 RepID=UPI002630498D|nr:endonuclease domain-containing protein [uncultured Parasphingopyxis sp.]